MGLLSNEDWLNWNNKGNKTYNISLHEKSELPISHCSVLLDKKLALKYLMERQYTSVLLDFSCGPFSFLFMKQAE